jgi:hypothetical protein
MVDNLDRENLSRSGTRNHWLKKDVRIQKTDNKYMDEYGTCDEMWETCGKLSRNYVVVDVLTLPSKYRRVL